MLAAAGFLVYSNSFHQVLHLDDLNNIQKNIGIRKLWPLSAALNPPPGPISLFTRPILNLTLAWDYAHSGENLAGYRRTNMTLHLLAGLMLYIALGRVLPLRLAPSAEPAWTGFQALPAWLRGVFRDGAQLVAFVAALIWMVHPLNTAAVNYLSQRGELLTALFLFALLYCLLRAAEAASARAWPWQAAAVGSCLLGMGSKENMLAAPLLALIFDRLFLADSCRTLLRRRGLLHGLLWLTALLPLHRQWLHSPHIASELMPEQGHWHYLLTQCWGLVHMIRLSFWPRPLVFYYGRALIADPLAVWPQALLLLILAGATLWALMRRPRAGFAGAFFFGVLAPSSTFVPILGQPVAEHRMYAALAALIVLAAGGLYSALGRLSRPGSGAALLLGLGLVSAAGLGVEAHRRNAVYRDPLVLWRDTVRKVPSVPEAHNNYANTLREAGFHAEAVEEYREALRLNPDFVDALVNVGAVLPLLDRHEEAVAHLEHALQVKPDSLQIHQNLGSVYVEMGRHKESVEHLEIVLRAVPNEPKVTVQLVQTLEELGRGEEALDRLRETLRVHPDNTDLNNAAGVLLQSLGRQEEALPFFRAVLDGSPHLARVRLNLGRALFNLDRLEEAEAEFNKVPVADPVSVDARNYLNRIQRRRAESRP